ncbi:WD40 repeat-like protein [Parathielavia appendiculata]|uniref:WD40 repeat-like protein n=1 Tax=Parathielavia appendiculata TaxID=2587402 RepID=A0AAN6Z1T2_9PEZI|nr:WD40 repeat-like protein [Parathielavia appendiculata]
MSKAAAFLADPPVIDDRPSFETIIKHGHQDLVQAVAFNGHGDRCATGSVDGKIRVFNRHKDGAWRVCDTWGAHASEILELQWLPTTIYPNLLASLGIEGRFKLWAEDPSAAPGRRFAESTRSGPLFTIPARALHLPASSTTSVPATGIGSPAPVPPATTTTATAEPPAATSTASTTATATATSFSSSSSSAKPAFETRNARSPYRSFSLKHLDDTRTTYLALLSADGGLTVYENDRIENLASFTLLDELSTLPEDDFSGPPNRGEETSFKVRFDPNPDVCYTALRAGVPSDALGLVVAVMDRVRVYRTRDTIRASLGVAAAWKGFYLAAEVKGGLHRGLVRDVAWAGGNIRGYDVIATACQDGAVRVFRLDALLPGDGGGGEGGGGAEGHDEKKNGGEGEGGGGGPGKWAAARVRTHGVRRGDENGNSNNIAARASLLASSGIRAGLDQSRGGLERRTTGLPGQIKHVMTEVTKLDCHRTPVWRVGFDDDGQILGSVGDEGKLMCYRQKPDGTWAKSAEMAMVKMKMAAP